MHWNLSIAFLNMRDIIPMLHPSQHIYLRTSWFSLQRQWSLHIDCSCLYYSTILDNTDISTSSKGKAPVSTNDIEVYNKEILSDKIYKLTTTNVQLITNKIKTEKIKVNLETNKIRLFDKKNSLVVKRKELRVEITALNTVKLFNVPIRRY